MGERVGIVGCRTSHRSSVIAPTATNQCRCPTHSSALLCLPSLQLLGEAIKTLPREDVIVCTKIGKTAPGDTQLLLRLEVPVHSACQSHYRQPS